MSLKIKLKKEDLWIVGNNSKNALHAFDGKPVIDPRLEDPREKVRYTNVQKYWRQLNSRDLKSPYQTVYVHIPFCVSRCPFCRFFEHPYNEKSINNYIKILKKEIEQFADEITQPVNAIYFGGGTPTVLSSNNIIQLLRHIKKYIPICNDCEITFESNLYSLSEDKMDACLSSGINRFSIGVQSFDTNVRRRMGRKLEKDDLTRKIKLLKRKGLAVISIDLIYGLPNQTMKIWEDDLRTFIDLGVDGIDLYQLEETQLKKYHIRERCRLLG